MIYTDIEIDNQYNILLDIFTATTLNFLYLCKESITSFIIPSYFYFESRLKIKPVIFVGLHQPPLNQGIVNPLLNPTVTNSVVAAVHSANAAAPASIAAAQPAPAAGNTSWAAAAGKGLPPSEPNQTNGATNKQLEQLNSVREALFSQVS